MRVSLLFNLKQLGWILICSSNERNSGSLIGTVSCVALGGILTFAVVGLTALLAPQLRRLQFDTSTLERIE